MIQRILHSITLVLSVCCLLTHSAAAEDSASIRIGTYNIRFANPKDGDDVWPNRKEAVAKYLQNFDIAGLQEVTEAQFDFLRQSLTDHDSYGVGRDDGKSGGEHAPIFYRSDRFESLEQGTFWLSETPDVVGSKGWDAALPRTCTWMRLRDRISGKTLLVANTHFDHVGRLAREESGKLLATRLSSMAGETPLVLLGDFNCQPDSAPYQAITTKLQDAMDVSKSSPTGGDSTWNGFREIAKGRRIDYVFVDHVTVAGVTIEDPRTTSGRFASDHLPVVAEIDLGL